MKYSSMYKCVDYFNVSMIINNRKLANSIIMYTQLEDKRNLNTVITKADIHSFTITIPTVLLYINDLT